MWNFALPEIEVGEALRARLAEVLDDAVDQLRVADLVLHLRRQRELALQRRRAEDPLALGQHAHQLRVAVHLDELDELRAVLVRHPVAGLDLAAGLHVLEEFLAASFMVTLPIGRVASAYVRPAETS